MSAPALPRRRLLVATLGLAAIGYGCDGSSTSGNLMVTPYDSAFDDTGVAPDGRADADAAAEASDAAGADADAGAADVIDAAPDGTTGG